MSVKTKAGIAAAVLGLLLLAASIGMALTNLASSGPWAGRITTFQPAFKKQGLLILFMGIFACFSFLGGIILAVIGKKD